MLNIVMVSNTRRHGFAGNFENAIAHCRGEFIALSDQDDVWKQNKLERMVACIGTNAIIHCDADVIDGNGRRIAASWQEYRGKPIYQEYRNYLSGWNNITGCTVLLRRDLLNVFLPIPPHILYHDLWLGLVAKKHGGIVFLKEPLMSYRLHEGNAIGISGPKIKRERKVRSEMQYLFFQDLLENSSRLSLSDSDVAHIKGLLTFWRNMLSRSICLMNLPIAIKYYKWLFRNNRPMIVNLILSLVGVGRKNRNGINGGHYAQDLPSKVQWNNH
jgi:glycosyltransferase involved in cell wall biosynthesis